jgi:hypothetical protein
MFQRLTTELLQVDCKADVNGPRREAFFVVAGLEAKFSGHHAEPRVSVWKGFEARGNFEISTKYRDRVGGKSVLFELRLGVSDLLGLEGLLRPGEFQGDEKLVGGCIAVGVEAGLQLRLEPYIGRGAALNS